MMKQFRNIILLGLATFMVGSGFVLPRAGGKFAKAKVAPKGELVWFEYVEKAYEESQKTGKPILANFTGSDWCGWCIRLHNEVFSKADFIKWADANVVLLELDYPRRTQLPQDLKKQNAELQQAFQVRGYPTIWLFDLTKKEDGNYDISALGKTGYVAGGPSPWINAAERILANKK